MPVSGRRDIKIMGGLEKAQTRHSIRGISNQLAADLHSHWPDDDNNIRLNSSGDLPIVSGSSFLSELFLNPPRKTSKKVMKSPLVSLLYFKF